VEDASEVLEARRQPFEQRLAVLGRHAEHERPRREARPHEQDRHALAPRRHLHISLEEIHLGVDARVVLQRHVRLSQGQPDRQPSIPHRPAHCRFAPRVVVLLAQHPVHGGRRQTLLAPPAICRLRLQEVPDRRHVRSDHRPRPRDRERVAPVVPTA